MHGGNSSGALVGSSSGIPSPLGDGAAGAFANLTSTWDFTGHPGYKKMRDGPPDCLEELEVMFKQTTTVDGSTSCIPGQVEYNHKDDGEEENCYVLDASIDHSPSIMKALCSTATSPKKLGKNPMVRVMKTISDKMEARHAFKAKIKDETKSKINKCMEMTFDCGAAIGTPEFNVATQLFRTLENKVIFEAIPKEERFEWLTIWSKMQPSA